MFDPLVPSTAGANRRYQMPAVELRPSKARPYYRIRYWTDALGKDGVGTRRRLSHLLGYADEMTKRQAEHARDHFFDKLNTSPAKIAEQLPLAELISVWEREHVSQLGAGTKAKYKNYVEGYIIPTFGELRLCDVTTQNIQAWLNRLQLSWASKSDCRNILSSIYSKAIDWGYWTGRNPVKGVSAGKKRATRQKQLLTPTDAARLLEELPTYLRFILEVCQVTGCRISEVLGLKWGDVDDGWATIRRRWYRGDIDVVKSDKAHRELPLGSLAAILEKKRCNDRDRFIFDSGNGQPWDDRGLLKIVREKAKELGIYFEGLGFHSFRRAAATAIQEAGASTVEAQLYLGHSRPSQTGEYTLLQRERLQSLIKKTEKSRRSSTRRR